MQEKSSLFDIIFDLLHGKPTSEEPKYIKLNTMPQAIMSQGISSNTLRMIAPQITQDQADIFAASINKFMPQYDMTQTDLPMFLCQALVESKYFTKNEEDLYYTTVKALAGAWNTRFSLNKPDFAKQYLCNPQKLANFVYANRYGNGDTASGDGWKHRGRGWFMYTFKSNYEALRVHYGFKSIDDVIAYLKTPDGSVSSAMNFWKTRRLNRFVTRDDVKPCTYIINGGYNGLQARENAFDVISGS